jgi:hypothetical protein
MEWAHQSPRFWFGIWGRHATAVEIFMGPVQGRGGQISVLCLRVHRGLSKNRTPDPFSGLHQTRFRDWFPDPLSLLWPKSPDPFSGLLSISWGGEVRDQDIRQPCAVMPRDAAAAGLWL